MTGPALPERYRALVDDIVQQTLKGKIASKAQVERLLAAGVERGTGEIFERCLAEKLAETQAIADNPPNEAKQAKAQRALRALQTLRAAWDEGQKANRAASALDDAAQDILAASPGDRLLAFADAADPNRPQPLLADGLRALAKRLELAAERAASGEAAAELRSIAEGIRRGLDARDRLEVHLTRWMYDRARGSLGFGGMPGQTGPWETWARECGSESLRPLFDALARGEAVADWLAGQPSRSPGDWAEWVLVLRSLQRGLVNWLDRQPYSPSAGKKLSVTAFLTFAALWSQLSAGCDRAGGWSAGDRELGAQVCFRAALQVLRSFAQLPYFPLYGGAFASFSGEYLQQALDYLDRPLRQVPNTQEKARMLVLLGDSQRVMGRYDRAVAFHEEALAIAQDAGDRPTEIASLNHLARTALARRDYEAAEGLAQRAVVLARSAGDRPGEANGLANLGYGATFAARERREAPDAYASAIGYLERGLQLAEREGDLQSRALCLNGLGIAQSASGQAEAAIATLTRAIETGSVLGDLYLQALNYAYLAQACFGLERYDDAVQTASLSAYWLQQLGADDWQQPAKLLLLLEGQLGAEGFADSLGRSRRELVAAIGPEGYEFLPTLIADYRKSLDR